MAIDTINKALQIRIKGSGPELRNFFSGYSSYPTMICKTAVVDWLTSDWILSQFVGSKQRAKKRYRQFVLDGIGQNIEIWSELKNQIYLGNEDFVSEMQGKLEKDRDLWGIPKKQRRAVAKSLSEIEQQSVEEILQ